MTQLAGLLGIGNGQSVQVTSATNLKFDYLAVILDMYLLDTYASGVLTTSYLEEVLNVLNLFCLYVGRKKIVDLAFTVNFDLLG